MNVSKIYCFCAAIFFTLCSSFVAAEPQTPDDYLKVFTSGSQFQKKKAAESLAWAGISSEKLFDLIEADVLAKYKQKIAKDEQEYLAWMLKALAFSGNDKYIDTLGKAAEESPRGKVKKYAKISLALLHQYKELNPIIAPKSWPEYAHPSLNQRLKNMFESSNYELIRIAGKRVHYTHMYDSEILELAKVAIDKHYSSADDFLSVDAMAWVCKAVAGSALPQYKETIVKVSENAGSKKLRNYAKKYLKYYK